MFLFIDNYDSFSYNLVQAFRMLGHDPLVKTNDDPEILRLAQDLDLETVCISPGPGHPENAGLVPEFLKLLPPQTPVLGVCLGHQLLGLHAGADIGPAPAVMHGKESEIVHDGEGIFKNIPNHIKVGRYHSLGINSDGNASIPFTITARGPDGEIMAIQYKDRPWVGLQFHPESVLTPEGMGMLANFPSAITGRKLSGGDYSRILERLAQGKNLSEDMAAAAFRALFDGDLSPAQAGALLLGLRVKGESALELAHAARAALARSVKVRGLRTDSIDIVGTGGDGRHSFNCSTASALIMAGMGYKVIKHGNRAVSSTCGSADALEGLGIPLYSDPEQALDMLEKRNFTFLFAPYFHPAFKNIGPLRKELGIRTLFNILGPLINPARPNHLLMGVASPELAPLVAETLLQAQLKRAAVVCGAGGYDEMTPLGEAEIYIIENGKIGSFVFDPSRYGINTCAPEDLAVRGKEEAVAVLKELLQGRGPKPMQDMMILNTALAVYLMEANISMDMAMEKAREAALSGAGMRALGDA